MSEWQLIESAPKDGTRILVWIDPGYITVGYWLTDSHKDRPKPFWGHELCGSRTSRARKYPPTHWQPLPASPAKPQQDDPDPPYTMKALSQPKVQE